MSVTPSKSIATQLLAWTDIASTAGTKSVGSAVDVSTKWGAKVFIRLGRQSGSAFTAGWPNVRIEGSNLSSGNNSWVPLWTYQMQLGASIANTTLSAGLSGGETSFGVAAATNIAAGDLLYLKDSSTSNYEIVRVASIASTTVTPEEPIVKAHANSSQVTDQAEIVCADFDLTTVTRLRYVVDNAGGGQSFAAEIALITFDSF